MRRIVGLVALKLVSAGALLAAQNSHTFYLSTNVRAGRVELPRGICEVSWTTESRPQAQVTFKTDDRRTIKVSARMIHGRQRRTGIVTSEVDGVTYLDELDTANAKFIFRSRDAPK